MKGRRRNCNPTADAGSRLVLELRRTSENDHAFPIRSFAMPADLTLSLVIPTYNERGNIQQLIEELCRLLNPRLPQQYELVVVDDDSPDRTWEIAEQLSAAMTHVRVLRRREARGLSEAVVAGWKIARGEWWAVIDADLQHPPAVVLQLVDALREGADLAVATRHLPGGGVSDWNIFRRMLSRGAQALAVTLVPQARLVSDPMSGYFAVRASAIDLSQVNPLGYKILLDVLAKGRFSAIREIPYVFRERAVGGSKVTLQQYAEFVRQVAGLWRSNQRRPR